MFILWVVVCCLLSLDSGCCRFCDFVVCVTTLLSLLVFVACIDVGLCVCILVFCYMFVVYLGVIVWVLGRLIYFGVVAFIWFLGLVACIVCFLYFGGLFWVYILWFGMVYYDVGPANYALIVRFCVAAFVVVNWWLFCGLRIWLPVAVNVVYVLITLVVCLFCFWLLFLVD